jgi:hypothetical protein
MAATTIERRMVQRRANAQARRLATVSAVEEHRRVRARTSAADTRLHAAHAVWNEDADGGAVQSELQRLDAELGDAFARHLSATRYGDFAPPSRDAIGLMVALTRRGARLVCEHYELSRCNLAQLLEDCGHRHADAATAQVQRERWALQFELARALLVTNPWLLLDRSYVGNGGDSLLSFVVAQMCWHFGVARRPGTVVDDETEREFFAFAMFCVDLAQACSSGFCGPDPLANDSEAARTVLCDASVAVEVWGSIAHHGQYDRADGSVSISVHLRQLQWEFILQCVGAHEHFERAGGGGGRGSERAARLIGAAGRPLFEHCWHSPPRARAQLAALRANNLTHVFPEAALARLGDDLGYTSRRLVSQPPVSRPDLVALVCSTPDVQHELDALDAPATAHLDGYFRDARARQCLSTLACNRGTFPTWLRSAAPPILGAAAAAASTSVAASSAAAADHAVDATASNSHSDPLVFELLRRRERSLLAALQPRSRLVDAVDDVTGLSPLHFVCVHVRGCRHRIVELLLCAAVEHASGERSGSGGADSDDFDWAQCPDALALVLQRACMVRVADEDCDADRGDSSNSICRQSTAQLFQWSRNRKLLWRLDERIQAALAACK